MEYNDRVSYSTLSRGLSPWYDTERKLRELGISIQFPVGGISADNLKRRGCRDDGMEVGRTRSRGVVGVIPYVSRSEGYSKGFAFMRSDLGHHIPDTVRGRVCKQN